VEEERGAKTKLEDQHAKLLQDLSEITEGKVVYVSMSVVGMSLL